jgi:PAS domain S-box-containing protein
VSASRHITDRRRAGKKIRHGDDFYRQLVEGSPDAMWVHCRDIIVYANRACVAFFGASSADELLGKQPLDFVHPDDREIVKQRIHKLYSELKPVLQNETRWIRLDGTEVYAEVVGTPVLYQGQAGAQVTFRDISERRRIEQNLRKSEANLAAAQRIAHLGSWEQDVTNLDEPDKCPPRWSDEVFRILGYEPGQIEPSRRIFLQSLNPDDRERHRNTLVSAFHENKSFSADYRIILPNGS